MLKLRRGRGAAKAHPLAARPLPLSAFAGRWPLRATLEPSRVAVFGDAEVAECGAGARGGPEPSFLVLQGDILFIFEDRRSLRLRGALWLDGYEVSAEGCRSGNEEGVTPPLQPEAVPPVELRHTRELAPGARLALRTAAASQAWSAALCDATRHRGRGGATAAAAPKAAPQPPAPPEPVAVRDAAAQAGDAAAAVAARAAAAEAAAAEAAQRAALLTWQLADARAAAAAAEQAAAAAAARADALAAELAAERSRVVTPAPPEPLPPPSPPGSIDAVQLPGAPLSGAASPRTPQTPQSRDAATPHAPRKARPTVWPAAAAHGARRGLRYEP